MKKGGTTKRSFSIKSRSIRSNNYDKYSHPSLVSNHGSFNSKQNILVYTPSNLKSKQNIIENYSSKISFLDNNEKNYSNTKLAILKKKSINKNLRILTILDIYHKKKSIDIRNREQIKKTNVTNKETQILQNITKKETEKNDKANYKSNIEINDDTNKKRDTNINNTTINEIIKTKNSKKINNAIIL